MTFLNEVLSITVVKCDSLINRVSFPGDSHYFKIRGPGLGAGWRQGRSGGDSRLRKGRMGSQLSSHAHKHSNREAPESIRPEPSEREWAINTGCWTGKSVSAKVDVSDR